MTFNVSFSKEEVASGKPLYNLRAFEFRLTVKELRERACFIQKDGEIFHTYSTYARGLDILLPMYNWLDLTAKGRDEEGISRMRWRGFGIMTGTRSEGPGRERSH